MTTLAQAGRPMTESSQPEVPEPRRRRPSGMMILVLLATLYTLYFARDFLLSPAVRLLHRLHLPRPLGSALVVLSLIGLGGFGVYQMAGPVQSWTAKAPAAIESAREALAKLLRPFERVKKTAEQVESATAVSTSPKAPVVVIQGPSIFSRVFGSTQRFLFALIETLILLFFLLAAGDLFLHKLIKVLPHLQDKLKAIRIAREVESSVSTYLATIAALNIVEGLVVAGALALLGMPSPLLWGALVAAFEFIPYLGAFSIVVILAIAALGSYPSVGRALMVPGAFVLINMLQVNVVSPLLLGHRLELNPVAVFIGLAFWFWIWGIPGAFIGVPLLAVLKICCDHIEALAPVGEFLGRKEAAAVP
ncbi:MAG TPA: AI-2E family transporter [Gemmatimonadales bacterium]|nr:AI-2E family transporter [Gemmatimonadales bacterium]